jgi:transcriptional regulator with XRE-family HTH domain
METVPYADRLRRARIRAGLSQVELSGRAELHATYLNRLEKGHRSPSLDVAERIAKALGRPDVGLDAEPPPTALDNPPTE